MALELEIVPDKAVVIRREKTVVAASWFGPATLRPYIYPFLGPGDRETTSIGHPVDPIGHSHHKSIWIAHHDVSGASFWEESPRAGRIEQIGCAVGARAGAEVGAVLTLVWKLSDGAPVLREERRLAFFDLEHGELALEIDTELRPAAERPVTLGATPFGLLGIRVARTMRVAEGLGGMILNSNEAENEAGCMGQHAEWCDYSGPVPLSGPAAGSTAAGSAAGGGLPAAIVGIACFNHPANASEDTLWHVRDDGWMAPCLSREAARQIPAGGKLRVRYRIESHAGRPGTARIDERFRNWRKR